MRLSSTVRAVAVLEATKGTLVLLVGSGAFALFHRGLQQTAERWIAHAHLDPAKGYPRIFLDFASQVTDSRLMLLAAGALAYSCVRFVEAYGLWFGRRWAEWLAALSATIYIPFELLELKQRVSPLSAGALVVNVVIVAIMVYSLRRPPRDGGPAAPDAPPTGR